MTRFVTVLCTSVLWLASVARADDAVLEPDDVVRAIEAHHPRIAAERARARASAGERDAARGAFDPTLRVTGDAQVGGYYEGARLDAMVEQPVPFAGAAFHAGYRVTEGDTPPYYGERETLDGGELRAGLRVPLGRDLVIDEARATRARTARELEAAEAQTEITRLVLMREGLHAYYRFVAAGRALEIAEAMYALARDRDQQLERLVAEGAVAAIERTENLRALLARRARVLSMSQRLGQAAIALSLFVRDDQGRPRIATRDELPGYDLDVTARDVPDMETAMTIARTARPERRRFEALFERADIARALARNGRLPRADARLTLSHDLGAGSPDATQRLAGTVLEANVTITSAVPNRAARGRVRARDADVEALEAEMRAFDEALGADVARALLDVRATTELVTLEREAADVAEALATAERRRFEEGVTSMLIVNLREQAAAEARVAVIERVAEALAARATLDAVLGRIDAR
jgi:cobalt-zinc-cadmium efflux system outer membrane protein